MITFKLATRFPVKRTASIAVAAVLLAGCSSPAVNTGQVGPASVPAATQQPAVKTAPPTWGQRYTWPSGIAIDIAEPKACKPSSSAAPGEIARAVKLHMTVTNGSPQPYDVGFLTAPTVQFASTKAESITDIDGPCGNGGMEVATVLPGKTYAFDIAYAVGKDPGELQVEFQTDFTGDKAVFVGKA